uniref:Uncharacterized protein n=1 Tax=Desulfobacca acetoxidans TaxID=60893 RepID=A0A7V4LDB5_9BACT
MTNKRGRPKGIGRRYMEFMDPKVRIRGCERTKVNFAYAMLGLDLFLKDETIYRKVFGSTIQDAMAGEKRLPKGSLAALEQVGRLITEMEATDDEKNQIVDVVQDAVSRGCTWADIRAHFRRLRLGDHEGEAKGVERAVLRAVAEFRKSFPKTPPAIIVQGLRDALRQVEAAMVEQGLLDREDLSRSHPEKTSC